MRKWYTRRKFSYKGRTGIKISRHFFSEKVYGNFFSVIFRDFRYFLCQLRHEVIWYTGENSFRRTSPGIAGQPKWWGQMMARREGVLTTKIMIIQIKIVYPWYSYGFYYPKYRKFEEFNESTHFDSAIVLLIIPMSVVGFTPLRPLDLFDRFKEKFPDHAAGSRGRFTGHNTFVGHVWPSGPTLLFGDCHGETRLLFTVTTEQAGSQCVIYMITGDT